MPGGSGAFFGLEVGVTLVRAGKDVRLPRAREGHRQHTLDAVYREMLLQICTDYPGLPDVRTLTLGEIRFFYDGLRPTLRRHTKAT